MTKYNHMYSVAFSLESERAEGADVTPDMLRTALLRRCVSLDDHKDWLEACYLEDTYMVEDE
jgi:hypothetical protein